MSDLFSFAQPEAQNLPGAPLAHRMRPRSLDHIAGHEKILAPGTPLRHWIETDRLPSLIFWGPPGCGKTTLARVIADHTQARFESVSAVTSGVKELKEAIERCRESRHLMGRRGILFVDEIHRFNKNQQDALLPYIEDGTVILIGATTENPSFELNSALLSRARVIRLERLKPEALVQILDHALLDSQQGLGGRLQLQPEALHWIASISEGDARRALNTLEILALHAGVGHALSQEEAQKSLESALERQPIPYDKSGEEHYNVISAFIKSIRDSDPHAGLYYLARMLTAGEDPLFIARRLVILASEDVGNADPRALQIAIATKDAVDFVGMPEARINLAQAVTYIALAPKSNAAYQGISEAMAEIQKTGALPVPMHLRNAITSLMKKEGYGQGYQYAHEQPQQRARQSHLPDEIRGKRFYQPKPIGYEAEFKKKLDVLNPDFD